MQRFFSEENIRENKTTKKVIPERIKDTQASFSIHQINNDMYTKV